ncbi:MAG: alpha/beta hydrolase [Pseudolysinimonas sp.]|uniref:alpha/beta hydrolase n=1 Tax=Pseudolysinimonas sp. TaxID=2680009 RepID=UPI0032650D35
MLNVAAIFATPAMVSVLAGAFGMSSVLPPVSTSDALAQQPIVSVATVANTAVGTVANTVVTTVASAVPSQVGAVPVAGIPNGVPQPFIGPDPVGGGASLDTIAKLDGVALLDQMVRLTPSELDTFVSAHPDVLSELVAQPPAALEVAQWWSRASQAARGTLSADLPGVVGNLDGVPYAARDVANRAFLVTTVDGIRAQLSAGVGRAMEDELDARLHMLGEVSTALQRGPSGAKRSLVMLDVSGDGRAVVAIGDLATADYVSILVPGMYFGVDAQLVDWSATADAMLVEQQKWITRLGLPGTAATVSWIGYHTPTVVSAPSMQLAYEGRDALTLTLQGIDATRVANVQALPFVSIMAHSYGSTAAMLALQENDVTVDALAVVGSPGSPANNVKDLKVTGGNVWVGAADWDPIPRTGVYGSQPLDADFGAHQFSVKGTTDSVTGETLLDTVSHNDYFAPGTTSQRNLALIALNQSSLVTSLGGLAKSASR